MKTRLLAATAVVLVLSACVAKERGEKAVHTPPVLTGVPVIARSEIEDTVGTAEAARVVFVVDLPPDSVAAFYRREMAKGGWKLVSEVADSAGTDFLAQRDGPPLWVRIRPGPRPGSTRYTVIGAVAAPPKADTARRGPGN